MRIVPQNSSILDHHQSPKTRNSGIWWHLQDLIPHTSGAPSTTYSDVSTTLSKYPLDLRQRALPPAISLEKRVDVEFYPKKMATTKLVITKPSRIRFNATVGCIFGLRRPGCSLFGDDVVLAPQKQSPPRKNLQKPTVVPVQLVPDQEGAHPCSGHGQLVDDICECETGWSTVDCSQSDCQCVNGDCLEGEVCQCWKGFRRTNCTEKTCATGCEDPGEYSSDVACECSAEWNGDNCYKDGCPNQCSGKEECVMDRQCCSSSNSCSSESVCSTAASPTEVLMRLHPMFNANFAQRVAFLIMEKSVQSYTDASQFNESLISVIQGRVMWGGNSGDSDDLFTSFNNSTVRLVGVRVSDFLYGFTLTRDDGYFDLTVNGARSVKKSVYVPPRQIIYIDDIIFYRQTGSSAPVLLMAPAKCSPTTRKLPEVLISNWQYTSDDQTDSCLVCDSSRSPAAPSTLLIGLLEDRIDEDFRKVHLDMHIKDVIETVKEYDRRENHKCSEPLHEKCWVQRGQLMLIIISISSIVSDILYISVFSYRLFSDIGEMGNGGYWLTSKSEPRVTTLTGIDAVVYAQNGSFIIGDHNLIRIVAPDGHVTTILTLGLADTSHSYYIAVSPTDGTVANSLPLHKQPQDSRNNYDVIAGDGTVCGSAVDSCGDDALAQNAQLIFLEGIAFDKSYLADNRRIRVIDTTGHIRSIGETIPDQHPIRLCARITKLVYLQMEWPTSLSIDPITDSVFDFDTNVVYKIDVEHDVVTVALGSLTTCDIANDHRRHLIQNALQKWSSDRSTFSILTGGKCPCSCEVAACGCDDAVSLLYLPVSMISEIRAASEVLLRILKRNDSTYDLETTLGEKTTLTISRDATKFSYPKRLLSSRVDVATAVGFEYDKYGRAVSLERDREKRSNPTPSLHISLVFFVRGVVGEPRSLSRSASIGCYGVFHSSNRSVWSLQKIT
ncbi:hypothetical protein CAEBREN_30078 [Caenorhabditis brenneri]|uniref:EGF-like domain-containing protein n=1 Tax=Caenorhabditis brenneri TaxID=135651 RepID=G0MGZ0_CAEBE|nr:hypothetical protein CAEBREN_30078 [Caenorhabditis brenneri]